MNEAFSNAANEDKEGLDTKKSPVPGNANVSKPNRL